jgi:PAS domain S-box-containing protein
LRSLLAFDKIYEYRTKEIKMIGKLPPDVLESLLETMPVEWSVIDADDNVLAWNRHETRLFRRPVAVVGRNVRNCHPPKSLAVVERLIQEMKDGKRDIAEFWIDKDIQGVEGTQKILIRYFALRDKNGKYLGCMETGMNITPMQKITGEKKLMD